jgi:hypothetical protein
VSGGEASEDVVRVGLDELPLRIGAALEAGVDVVIRTEAVASPERRAAVLKAAAASAHVSGSPDGTFADLDDIRDALRESGAALEPEDPWTKSGATRSGAGAGERHGPLVHLPGEYVSASQDLNELMVVSRLGNLGESYQHLIDCATVCVWVSDSCVAVMRVEDMRVLAELEYGSGPYDCMFPGSTTETFLHSAAGLLATLRSSGDWEADEGGIVLEGCSPSPISALARALTLRPDVPSVHTDRLIQAAFLEGSKEVNVLGNVLAGGDTYVSAHYRFDLRGLTAAEAEELGVLRAIPDSGTPSWWDDWADEVSRLVSAGQVAEWELEYTARAEYGRRLLGRGAVASRNLA